ncbi:hypothetical protein EDD96_7084 [Streptomyces sp. Ag109_G2-6]|nr:hypothetical protein EDD96_7084 [Streptomyces sp. Ag109_G2-6]
MPLPPRWVVGAVVPATTATYGRITSTTDAAGAKTTTVYEPATLVPNAKGWTTTTTFHPLRGFPAKTVGQEIRVHEEEQRPLHSR